MNYIACFGDSLIQGFPYSNQNSWTAEVEKHAEIKMLNYGVCGDCCDDIFERVRNTVLPENVRHILFLGGANDIIQGRPQKYIMEDFRKLTQWCTEKNYSLCIVLPLISADAMLNVPLQAIGRSLQERFADKAYLLDLQPGVGMSSIERRRAYLDGVHPKATTYKDMGKYAVPFLVEWLDKTAATETVEAAQEVQGEACGLLETPIGTLCIKTTAKGISSIEFTDEAVEEVAPQNTLLLEAKKQLQEYFAKKRTAFDLPLDVESTEFQEKVWEELKQIPYGEVRYYQEVATAVGNPKAARAVGMANNRNPICIVVPCHRVVGKNNNLAGYAGGVERKEFLLNLEKGE